jgi:hypothetical protein
MPIRTFAMLLSLTLLPGALAAPRDPARFTGVLEELRAHADATLQSAQQGNRALALQHATHASGALYAAVRADLTPAQQSRFQQNFRAVGAQLAGQLPAALPGQPPATAALRGAVARLSGTVDAALASVPAATRQDPKYAARVISLLLEHARTAYGRGVRTSAARSFADHDARFTLARATDWLERFRTQFPADQGGQTASALKQASALVLARAAAGPVNTQLDRARTELAEISGEPPAQASGMLGEFDRVRALLASARSHYRAGRSDAANEAVISAYLDHFEQLERPLAQKNAALERKLEEALKNGLRTLIRQRVSPAQFGAALDVTAKDLATARSVLR